MSTRGACFVLCVAGISIAVIVAAMMFRPALQARYAPASSSAGLCGEAEFDFGSVVLESQPIQVEHVFELTNCSKAPITITRAVASCGCTIARVPDRPIEADGTARIPVNLTISDPGLKSAQVALEFAGSPEARLVLRIRAVGRRSRQLRFQPAQADFRIRDSGRVTLYAVDQDSTVVPPTPVVASPDGVEVQVGPWDLVASGTPGRGVPSRWECRLDLKLRKDNGACSSTSEGDLHVSVAGYPDVRVSCRLPRPDDRSSH